VIAALRGMFSVVNYLLVHGGANLNVRGEDRRDSDCFRIRERV